MWSDDASENAVRIAEGVYMIPMTATARNNHLSFLRLSYFVGASRSPFWFNLTVSPDSPTYFIYCDEKANDDAQV